MKPKLSRTQVKQTIDEFFSKKTFTKEQVKKIRKLAMKYNLSLKEKRRLFCKKCLSQLKGKTRVTRFYKTIICQNCEYKNRHKI